MESVWVFKLGLRILIMSGIQPDTFISALLSTKIRQFVGIS